MEARPLGNRRWTRPEYDRLIARGAFHAGERLELLDGQLVAREPQGSRHAVAIELALRALERALGPEWRVRIHLPVALDAESEPEPDLSVVRGDPRSSVAAHPASPVLVVEVADASLAFDREHKGGLYARAGVGDGWIVNLFERVLEVRRDPVAGPLAPSGWRYASCRVLAAGTSVSLLAVPSASVAVAALLP